MTHWGPHIVRPSRPHKLVSFGSVQCVPLYDGTSRSVHHPVPVMRCAFSGLRSADLYRSQARAASRLLVHDRQHHTRWRHTVTWLPPEYDVTPHRLCGRSFEVILPSFHGANATRSICKSQNGWRAWDHFVTWSSTIGWPINIRWPHSPYVVSHPSSWRVIRSYSTKLWSWHSNNVQKGYDVTKRSACMTSFRDGDPRWWDDLFIITWPQSLELFRSMTSLTISTDHVAMYMKLLCCEFYSRVLLTISTGYDVIKGDATLTS